MGMNYEKLGFELKTATNAGLLQLVCGIVEATPKTRHKDLLLFAGFFKCSDFALVHGFSRQYAHRVLNSNQKYRQIKVSNSTWWIKYTDLQIIWKLH